MLTLDGDAAFGRLSLASTINVGSGVNSALLNRHRWHRTAVILNSVSLKSRDFGRRVHKIRVILLFMSYRQTALTLCLSINVNWFSLLK